MSRIIVSIATIFAVVMAFSTTGILAADITAPQSPVKLIFIHHSTGGNWLADPNTDQPYGGLGASLMNNNYYVSATNYGWGPNAVGDRTDTPNWPEWFTGPNSATILDALYHENGQNIGEFGVWPRLGTEPGGENEVIMFKSCFPNSDLFGNPHDPPAPSIDDSCTVGNAKAVYNDLLTYFETRQDKLFVVITSPPQNENEYGEDYQTPAQRAANARAFMDWLVNDWLDGYAYSNVAVFDYYNVLTGANNHHRWHNGAVQHVTGTINNFSAYPSGEWDSHPCTAGQQKATEELVPLLNYFYNCWREGGGGPTPTISPTIDIKVNGSDSEVTIDTSGSVTIGLSLDVGSYAGVDADWWLVHLPPSGVLRSFDLGTMSFEDGLSCVIGTGLFSFPFVPITSLAGLEAGSHILCFGVDTVMNEALDVDGLYYNCSTVAVSPGSPGGGGGDDDNNGDPVDISGIWDCYWPDEVGTTEYFSFTQSGSSLSGYWYDDEEGPLDLSGTISGRNIDVIVHYPYALTWNLQATVNESVTEFSGKVVVTGVLNGEQPIHCVRRGGEASRQ